MQSMLELHGWMISKGADGFASNDETIAYDRKRIACLERHLSSEAAGAR